MTDSESVTTRVSAGGRVVIPASYRKALGLREGDAVLLRLKGKEISLISRSRAVEQAQAIVRRYVKEGDSLVDELIAERRAEARRE